MSTISVSTSLRTRSVLSKKVLQFVVAYVLKKEKRVGGVSIHLVGKKRIHTLNTQYRGVDSPTDVLSFGMGTDWQVGGEEFELGDIWLCQPYIIDQAKRFDVSSREEMIRLTVHGTLHLVGYDHETKKEATEMFAKQETYLKAVTKLI
jgi:probable rRNA maturation factor